VRRTSARGLLVCATLTVALLTTRSSRAYTIKTAVSPGCHEDITASAFQDFLLEAPVTGLELPQDKTWRRLARFILEFAQSDTSTWNDAQRFMFVSLIIGVRSPDTAGHSISNLDNLRQLHGDPRPEGQYAHGLRAIEDDHAAGNAAAVQGTRALIRDLVLTATDHWARPADEQIIHGRFYLDFYGPISVDVWAPLYYLGRAAHALQDTFSHSIRSDEDNLRKIVHVLNFVDAIARQFNENRDGLAHSESMDECTRPGAGDAVNAAVEATIDLFYAARAQFEGSDPEAVETVLDKWVILKEGCSKANDFCNNRRWLDLVREEQTEPFVEAIFGCRSTGRSGGGTGAVLLSLAALFLLHMRTRRRKRNRP
jgi:hypothetical protein